MKPSDFSVTRLLLLSLVHSSAYFLIVNLSLNEDQQQLVSCKPEVEQQQQQQQQQQHQDHVFPGVSRDLASFCAARPSLPVELTAMIVHVKRNVSFNYKLYLFADGHVFQTGQIVPRDHFRVHAFPVKVKSFDEFWPEDVRVQFMTKSNLSLPESKNGSSRPFDKKQFLSPVALHPPVSKKRAKIPRHPKLPLDATSDHLPGDTHSPRSNDQPQMEARRSQTSSRQKDKSFKSSDAEPEIAETLVENLNKNIEFDRDDSVRINRNTTHSRLMMKHKDKFSQDTIVPVGSFSSFHVNVTYLVRKDFDQSQPEIIRLEIDASKFQVKQLSIIGDDSPTISSSSSSHSLDEDYAFLSHKLLRDKDTRITSISQIYEDWITRNFYTIVYVQRRLSDDDNDPIDREQHGRAHETATVTDRLIFRGSSSSLLGADKLDYDVKATAFITEKSGLHYYLEFLTNGKFYLCAIDWSQRPFRIIDSRRFPIKAARTQLDNEELLLCPPAVCYSNQPIDEIVAYGRISPAKSLKRRDLDHDSRSDRATYDDDAQEKYWTLETSNGTRKKLQDNLRAENSGAEVELSFYTSDLIDSIKQGSARLQTKLHIRDWVWNLTRRRQAKQKDNATKGAANQAKTSLPPNSFELRYESAQRNDIKAKPDVYGYVLAGNEIEASYRVLNELYLISANHLITINYTMPNETVVSSIPISDEFSQLTSTLIDPITAAYYDRYTNQIYFFKGDRYIGFDYANKKPLLDFLQEPTELGYLIEEPQLGSGLHQAPALKSLQPTLTSLPVVGLLGRQHPVDGIYHDLLTDLVYVFTGMKFYTFEATEFKNGSLRYHGGSLPEMHCINEYFIDGCKFDEAYPNPCIDEAPEFDVSTKLDTNSNELEAHRVNEVEESNFVGDHEQPLDKELNFDEEQQLKLRSIAAKSSLFDLLVGSSFLGSNQKKLRESLLLADRDIDYGSAAGRNVLLQQPPEKLIIYLLTAMMAMLSLTFIVVVLVLISWCRKDNFLRWGSNEADSTAHATRQGSSGNYLNNQRDHLSRRVHREHHYRNPYSRQQASLGVSANRGTSAMITPAPNQQQSVGVVTKTRRYSSDVDNSAL